MSSEDNLLVAYIVPYNVVATVWVETVSIIPLRCRHRPSGSLKTRALFYDRVHQTQCFFRFYILERGKTHVQGCFLGIRTLVIGIGGPECNGSVLLWECVIMGV